MTLSQASA